MLTAGTRLGPYEVVSSLGAGGMGEVYRARDSRLQRDVAIKVLPQAVASDPDRLARFTREAQVLASLNHPNIAHVYGVEEADGIRGLVMELVDGETLAERIARGPVPADEAMAIARQIAEALDSAHERGVVHRDLKPANIKITGDGAVKVLDFGLAKAIEGTGEAAAGGGRGFSPADQSPTLTTPAMTQAGIILGTAAYMSPEQARGKTVDKRADIWAFGVVLYEMLTGRPLFAGETVSDTIAEVLKREFDWRRLPADTPAPLVRLLQRCLQRDPRARLRDIGDAFDALDAVTHTATPAARRSRWQLAFALAAALAVTASVMLVVTVLRSNDAGPGAAARTIQYVWHESVEASWIRNNDNSAAPYPAVSPDGRLIAFAAADRDGIRHIWIQPLDRLAPTRLEGTRGGTRPFWSPDSRTVAFFADRRLYRIAISGDDARVIAELSADMIPAGAGGRQSGTWRSDDTILFSAGGRLHRVAASGGSPKTLEVTIDSNPLAGARWPVFLPDGSFLFIEGRSVRRGRLDATEAPELLKSDSKVVYAGGFLLFGRNGALHAQRFDVKDGTLVPGTTALDSLMMPDIFGEVALSASDSGVLVYKREGTDRTQLVRIDRHGKELGALGPADASFLNPSLSRDGGRAAVAIRAADGRYDLWLIDTRQHTHSRFTFDEHNEFLPAWSPDGQEVAFTGGPDGVDVFYRKRADGAAAASTIREGGVLHDWSPNGNYLWWRSSTGLWYAPAAAAANATMYLARQFSEDQPMLSPDGTLVAYTAAESGQPQVYLRPFPDATQGKWQVSYEGGREPRWRADGRELYYITRGGEETLRAVSIERIGRSVRIGQSVALFRTQFAAGNTSYAVWPDGTSFLINRNADVPRGSLAVVINWQGLLQRSQ